MKPQLILQDLNQVGIHNGDRKRTRTRLKPDIAWKRKRIVEIIPMGATVPAKVYLCHRNMFSPPNAPYARILGIGIEVGEAYSNGIEQILAHPELSTWEYVLTLEHDNMPPPDGIVRLVERMEANPRFDAIGGLYYTKGYGGVPQIWGDPTDPVLNFRPRSAETGQLVECNGTGMGFTLFRMKIFKDKRLRRPWFVTETRHGVGTQDLYAWNDWKKYGYRCAVDCAVRVGHYDFQNDVCW